MTTEALRPTVLIVDDDPSVRAMLADLLTSSGLEVVGNAHNGLEGVALTRALRPMLVTMDLEMPVLDGAEATRQICAEPGAPPVVIVSGSTTSDRIPAALAAGARCHVQKQDATTLLPAILLALASAYEANDASSDISRSTSSRVL